MSRVVRDHRAGGHGVSTSDASAETFTIGGCTARISRDYSRFWDSDRTFGQSPPALLKILERKIVEHATAQDHPWLDTVLESLAAENLLAAPWRRVLAAAAQVPEVLGLRLAEALQSPVVLLAHDLRDAAGALLAAVYPLLAVPARERTERVIMALPETAAGDPAGRDYAD